MADNETIAQAHFVAEADSKASDATTLLPTGADRNTALAQTPGHGKKNTTGSHPEDLPHEQTGLFSGWGFPDLNAVTGSLGGLFGDHTDQHPQQNSSSSSSSQQARQQTEMEENEQDANTERPMQQLPGDDYEDDDRLPGEHTLHSVGNNIGKVAGVIVADATKEFEHASRAAQETLGKAAEEIGKGWGTLNNFLDDMLSVSAAENNQTYQAADDVHSRADYHHTNRHTDDGDIREGDDVQAKYHALFPDADQDDDVVDHYSCSLLQKYRCYLNNATPEKSFSMGGRLFVTTSSIAMHVFDAGAAFGKNTTFSIAVPFGDVTRVQKGAKSMMRVITKSQTSFIFANFESETHFGAALSLVEHMIESTLAVPEDANVENSSQSQPEAAAELSEAT